MDCNHNGECINNDLCNCHRNFIGKYCNENLMLGRVPILDLVLYSIGVFIIFVIIILIGMILYFRNHTVIKGGSNEINNNEIKKIFFKKYFLYI